MTFRSPALTVDGILIQDHAVLLIQRKQSPYEGSWALPGGFVEYGEKTEDAVIRELAEETGLQVTIHGLLGVYSDPHRDPRGHTVTIVYLMNVVGGKLESGDDACDAKFFELEKLPELAFDHDKIINDVNRWMK